MSGHTPGPWEIVAEDGHGCSIYAPEAGDVAEVHWLDSEGKANARLIAAAPDLLEALKVLLYATMFKDHPEESQLAIAAIAKAEGR